MKPFNRKDALAKLGRRRAHAERVTAADARAEAARLHEIAERVAAIQPPDGPVIINSKKDGRGLTREGCAYLNKLILAGMTIDDVAHYLGIDPPRHLVGLSMVYNIFGPMTPDGHEPGWQEYSPSRFSNSDWPDGLGGTTRHAPPAL